MLQQNRLRIFIACAIIIGFLVLRHTTSTKDISQTFSLSTGPVEHVVKASGNIASAGSLDVYTTINGAIVEYYVQNGQTVDVQTPLFKITSTASPQAKQAAKAAYLTSIDEYNAAEQNKLLYQAQLEQAREAVLGKADGLDDYLNKTTDQDDTDRDIAYSQDWSARKLFDNAEKKYIDATQTLQAKSQNISAKKAAYDATLDQVVTSTVAGTVANINPQIGDEVYILTNTKAEPVLTLSNFDTYTVQVNVSENDIYRIQLGQQADVIVESFPDNILTGTVSKVDSIGTVDNGLVTYTVTVELNGIDIRMRAGMTAEVDITTDSRENALLVPNAALADTGTDKVVYIDTGQGDFTQQAVQIGLKGVIHSEVISGLQGSETLLDPLEITSASRQ